MKKFYFWLVFASFSIVFVFFATQLYLLQVGSNIGVKTLAQVSDAENLVDISQRKLIFFTDKFQNKIPVVLNKNFPEIYASPNEIPKSDVEKYADLLASITGINKEVLISKLSNDKSAYYPLIKKASYDEESKIKDLELTGIHIRERFFRYYPYNTLASHLLGFVGLSSDDLLKGRYGLERMFDKWLSGESEFLLNNVNDSDGLYLTIDRNIQAEASKILKDLVNTYDAAGGTVIVENPQNGEILAMESIPSFDPNKYWEYDIENFSNPAIEHIYEPGSVFKPLTMAAGIDSGAITPSTTYYDTGVEVIDGREIRNWDLKAHGLQTMTNVLEHSINTGAIFAERKTGHKVFTEYIEKFGFGKKTGILLPGEVSGSIKPLYNGRDINYATASFGQGVSVTPIQLVSAYSAIANGGLLMKPLILKNEKPEVIRRVIKKETAEQVTRMLVSAVDKNYVAKIENYQVAGKTGTAFIPDFQNGGYTDNVINTYIGYAPASNPRFVILIKLEKPKGAPLAGMTVVPAFKKLASYILNYYDVSPDRVE